jgi:glycosyltransferase involved in cell wall biosynthesis
MKNIAIGAIFRDEFDYIIEWLAWHLMAGFSDFYIADNSSTDGTKELLEALSDLGIIKIIYQPVVDKQAQIRAYNRIAQMSIDESDVILFIDADEFLTHESMENGAEYEHLRNLFKCPEVGMVGINWRCFGSSDLEKQDSRPVLERFTWCLEDSENSKNGHLKSASRIKFTRTIGPHKSDFLEPLKRISPSMELLKDFIKFESGNIIPVENSGITAFVCRNPLRVNHYVIKSKQEFIEKKNKRGDVMAGVNHEKGMVYFDRHDFKDCEFYFPKNKIEELKLNISKVEHLLESSKFVKTLRGVLDINNSEGVQGWLVDEIGSSKGIKVNIFLNGIYQGSSLCGFYRPDLYEKKISGDGLSGFRWTHPKPLLNGDVVEVFVHANRFKFQARERMVMS